MEAVLLHSTPDQSISSYKQNRNPKRNIHAFISRSSENFAPSNHLLNTHGGGLFFGPPPYLSSSFSSSSALVFNNKQQQPPLLPLPFPKPKPYSSLPPRNNKGLSYPPTNKKSNNKTRDLDLTPKKLKSSTSPIKQDSKKDSRSITTSKTTTENLVITSTNRMGPDPSNLPKEVSRVLKPVISSTTVAASTTTMEGAEKFSSSIFSLAPPPSSLPLPKFSLRPKLSCNVEAGGIDAGATDNLRRLLRLR